MRLVTCSTCSGMDSLSACHFTAINGCIVVLVCLVADNTRRWQWSRKDVNTGSIWSGKVSAWLVRGHCRHWIHGTITHRVMADLRKRRYFHTIMKAQKATT